MTALTTAAAPRPGRPPRAVLRPHRTTPALRGPGPLTAPHPTGAPA
ncbi:hypothetical protein [Streptomyces sp. YS415]|nr:hypothetical protein [Streptomyces sp. YS415]